MCTKFRVTAQPWHIQSLCKVETFDYLPRDYQYLINMIIALFIAWMCAIYVVEVIDYNDLRKFIRNKRVE